MIVVPSIDISEGKAVKRIGGRRGTGLVLGDPVSVAKSIYEEGYDYVHVVDLDAAEGVGSNEELIKEIAGLGFSKVEVGGGIRDRDKARRLISYGVTYLVLSTVVFKDRKLYEDILQEVGEERVLASVDYCDDVIYVKGWSERAIRVEEGLRQIGEVAGVIFTNICKEGKSVGIDEGVGKYLHVVRGLKGYAGGIRDVNDLEKLKGIGFDFAVVGMSFYTGNLRGVKYV
ncbi:MAG: 1-(5-phosphoribosyl)-5-((5-phosphoribosylamino)methylideneamino)imidazole-4-carboxamide isomerase [Candidatus Aramenus sp.]|nr:1-(5-phosphoribosyl)-5-((5-phosphoribosylamino)methylideneamino)imidazole-4-carboxamide isomerase [Candidatus Aramenus sp.]